MKHFKWHQGQWHCDLDCTTFELTKVKKKNLSNAIKVNDIVTLTAQPLNWPKFKKKTLSNAIKVNDIVTLTAAFQIDLSWNKKPFKWHQGQWLCDLDCNLWNWQKSEKTFKWPQCQWLWPWVQHVKTKLNFIKTSFSMGKISPLLSCCIDLRTFYHL